MLGNHELMAIEGSWNINEDRFGLPGENSDDEKEDIYLRCMSNLPLYYEIGNVIFVHTGIDEEAAADGLWEYGTSECLFTEKYPAQIGKIEGFDMKIVAGHIGTYVLLMIHIIMTFILMDSITITYTARCKKAVKYQCLCIILIMISFTGLPIVVYG